jgi:hypothetical protein
LGFEYLVTLGEGDPGLLAARPKMPRRPQPRRIEAAGAHTHYAAARLAISQLAQSGHTNRVFSRPLSVMR